MANDSELGIDENALAAEAVSEANDKIAADTAKKKQSVESSIKKVLDEVGVDAEFQEADDKLVVEIPLGSEVDKETLVSKLLSEKMENARKEAEIEAERKAQEEIAKRQKEIEEEALRKAEEKARLEAEEKVRKLAEEKRIAEEKAAAQKKAEEEKAAAAAAKIAAKQKEKEAAAEKKAQEELARKKAAEEKAAKIKAKQEEEKKAQEQKEAEDKAKAEKKEKRKIANAEREKKVKEMVDKAKANKVSKPVAKTDPNKFMPNFKRHYLDNVREKLQKEFNYSSSMEIPRITKITVSLGCSEDKDNKKYLDAAVKELEQITGQHVVRTKAHKSIANFKIRQGQEIGAMVTLRNDNMWYFLERLISVALPRVRDFRGVKPNAFDGHGNYSLGITEQIIFPEIDFDKIEKVSGFNIAFVTTAKNDKEGYALLKELGMPFSK